MLVMQVILLEIMLTIMIMVMALMTKQLVMITMLIPGRAGRNQTRLSKGTWEGVDTIRGVICISVKFHFFF